MSSARYVSAERTGPAKRTSLSDPSKTWARLNATTKPAGSRSDSDDDDFLVFLAIGRHGRRLLLRIDERGKRELSELDHLHDGSSAHTLSVHLPARHTDRTDGRAVL